MSMLGRLLVIAGLKSDPNEIPPEERVLKTFREKLNVYRVEKSRVIVIEFSSEDPKLAAEIPNAIADAYLAVQRGAKQQSNSDATDWLEPEIADLTKRVKEAEAQGRRLPRAVGPADRPEQFGAGHAAAVRAVDRTVARARQPRRGRSQRRKACARRCRAAPRSMRCRKCCRRR